MFSCSNGHSVWVGGSTKFASTKNFAQMFRKKSEWNDCDSKLFMSFHVKWLKMLKLVRMRHCWQMVEAWTWWKCQFLTNLWDVEITPQEKTRSPIRRPSPIFHPQIMRPTNSCKSLATSKFGKLLKMLNGLACEIDGKWLKNGHA